MTAPETAFELRALADRVRRLAPPSHRDPEQFFVERSELAEMLREMASEIERTAS